MSLEERVFSARRRDSVLRQNIQRGRPNGWPDGRYEVLWYIRTLFLVFEFGVLFEASEGMHLLSATSRTWAAHAASCVPYRTWRGMISFAGYEMPVHYPAGFLTEHLHARKTEGLFDILQIEQIAPLGDLRWFDRKSTGIGKPVPADKGRPL
jgi:hypothetical protein